MNRTAAAGLAVLAALSAMALLAPALTEAGWIAPPLDQDLQGRLQPPGFAHWLGTDAYGRDVFSRLLHGARSSLLVALLATLVAIGIGVPAGALAGFRGGLWDLTLTRLMEATAALPSLPLILLIVSMTIGGSGGGFPMLIVLAAAIGVTRWASIARYVRGGVFRARTEEYAAAAVAIGSSRARLLARHLLPGAVAPALVSAAFSAGSAVLMESALSFLGLGTQPPTPSWGRMVAESAHAREAWWLLLAPGAAIGVLVMGFNLVAEGIRLGAARVSSPRG